MDEFPLQGNGTQIWNLCKMAVNIIKDKLHWVLGNGKRLRIWKDNLGFVSPSNHSDAS